MKGGNEKVLTLDVADRSTSKFVHVNKIGLKIRLTNI